MSSTAPSQPLPPLATDPAVLYALVTFDTCPQASLETLRRCTEARGTDADCLVGMTWDFIGPNVPGCAEFVDFVFDRFLLGAGQIPVELKPTCISLCLAARRCGRFRVLGALALRGRLPGRGYYLGPPVRAHEVDFVRWVASESVAVREHLHANHRYSINVESKMMAHEVILFYTANVELCEALVAASVDDALFTLPDTHHLAVGGTRVVMLALAHRLRDSDAASNLVQRALSKFGKLLARGAAPFSKRELQTMGRTEQRGDDADVEWLAWRRFVRDPTLPGACLSECSSGRSLIECLTLCSAEFKKSVLAKTLLSRPTVVSEAVWQRADILSSSYTPKTRCHVRASLRVSHVAIGMTMTRFFWDLCSSVARLCLVAEEQIEIWPVAIICRIATESAPAIEHVLSERVRIAIAQTAVDKLRAVLLQREERAASQSAKRTRHVQ